MRVIEELLMELNPENYTSTVRMIEGQLEYYKTHAMEVQGISLIPIVDSVVEKYPRELLRANGYVLNLA